MRTGAGAMMCARITRPAAVMPARPGTRARRVITTAFAGVDYEGNTRNDLYARACLLCVPGRSRMSKAALAQAIAQAEAAFTAQHDLAFRTLQRAA